MYCGSPHPWEGRAPPPGQGRALSPGKGRAPPHGKGSAPPPGKGRAPPQRQVFLQPATNNPGSPAHAPSTPRLPPCSHLPLPFFFMGESGIE